MKHLVDLGHIANYIKNGGASEDAVLDILYEHACELKLTALIEAIEMYWRIKADQLTAGLGKERC
jgi:hypothetical protein